MITLGCEHRFNCYLLRYKMTYIKIPDSEIPPNRSFRIASESHHQQIGYRIS